MNVDEILNKALKQLDVQGVINTTRQPTSSGSVDDALKRATDRLATLSTRKAAHSQPDLSKLGTELGNMNKARSEEKQKVINKSASKEAATLLKDNMGQIEALETQLREDVYMPLNQRMSAKNRLYSLKQKQAKLRSDSYRASQ